MTQLTPPGDEISFFQGVGDLPHFNPDLELIAPPESVSQLRIQLSQSACVFISCPEYAHGIPGSFKNALDWVVGSGELVDKPVGIINLSSSSTFAQASLIEILTVMSARIVPDACLTLTLPKRSMNEAEILAEFEIVTRLKVAIEAIRSACSGS